MCGISGIVVSDTSGLREHIGCMNSALAHRGPDDEGTFVRDNVGFGHRRLCIIDPRGGAQPMGDEHDVYFITYNGELYNFQELRSELEKLGHYFRTNSDTEVVLKSYKEWGEACVSKFRGMFAFAIADYLQKKVFLARDHFGIKPLVYTSLAGKFAFASELSALKTLSWFPRDIDLSAIDQYLWLQYIPAPKTAYRHAKKLPPGHTLTVHFTGHIEGPKRYASWTFRPDQFRSGPDWLEALSSVIHDSVRAHCIADVPFGAFLSGGVDSSTVVTHMTSVLHHPVHTFSIGFQEKEFDESPWSREVAEKLGTIHTLEILEPNALEVLPTLVAQYGEPFGDSSAIPTYYISRLARKSVPMVLSGDGGDEAFAGYNTYFSWMTLPAADRTLERWQSLIAYMEKNLRSRLWKQDFQSVISDRVAVFDDAFARTHAYAPSHMAQYMDLNTYLPNCILPKVDGASMAHGLEVRTPLTDTEIWKIALSIPERWNMRLKGGQWEGKMLLKELLKRKISDATLTRRKQGFAVPIDKWFTRGGVLRAFIEERIDASDSPLRDLFEKKGLEEVLDSGRSGSMWLLLVLDEWLRSEQKA